VLLVLDDGCAEATAEQVSRSAMALVEPLRILGVQVTEGAGDVARRRLDDQVVVVRHQAPRVHVHAKANSSAGHERDERRAVIVVLEDLAAIVPSRGHVVVAARLEAAWRARHVGQTSGTPTCNPATRPTRHQAGTKPSHLAEPNNKCQAPGMCFLNVALAATAGAWHLLFGVV
jgi:hypothetical protein